MFSGNKDVDFLILNRLEDEDLGKMFQVNKYMYSISQNDFFWINRIEQYFEIDSQTRIESKAFFEFNTWKELYIYLWQKNNDGILMEHLELYVSCQAEIETLLDLIIYPKWIIPEIFKLGAKRNNVYLIVPWRGMEDFLNTFVEYLLDFYMGNRKTEEYISKYKTL